MIQIMSSNGEISYGVNDYVIDTDDELNEIPNNAEGGSTAYSIESGTTFIKDNMNEWSILNTSASSGGGIIELPDNILYSYEMTEEEFWDGYSQGVLGDGLYGYDSDIGLGYPKRTTTLQPAPDVNLTATYNNYCWAISYENWDSLLQFDEQGNVINKFKLKDYLSLNHNISIDQDSTPSLAIDGNGFLYLNCCNLDDGYYWDDNGNYRFNSTCTISVNLNNANDFTSWKMIDSINDENEINYPKREWLFTTFSYNTYYQTLPDKLLLTQEGGIFGVYKYGRASDGYNIAYFKDGEMKAIAGIETSDSPNSSYGSWTTRQLYAVDPQLNILYYIRFKPTYGHPFFRTELWKFDPNAEKEQQCTVVGPLMVDTTPNIKSSALSARMYFKNDLLYISWISDNGYLHYILYDTITANKIQEETISLTTYEGNYDYFTHMCQYFYPYEFKNHIYAPVYIPYYNNGQSLYYLKMIDIDYENLIVDTWDIHFTRRQLNTQQSFVDSCIDNYFLFEHNNQFVVYDLVARKNVLTEDYSKNSYVFWNNELPDKTYFIISYSQNDSRDFTILKIDPKTGNVQKKENDDSNYSSYPYLSDDNNLLLYLKDLNKILYTNSYMIDPDTLEGKMLASNYYYYHKYLFGEIKNRKLFSSNNQANTANIIHYKYSADAKKQYSVLLHRGAKVFNYYQYNLPDKEGVDI